MCGVCVCERERKREGEKGGEALTFFKRRESNNLHRTICKGRGGGLPLSLSLEGDAARSC